MNWRYVVVIDLPDGKQISYHMNPETYLYAVNELPEFTSVWDGKYSAKDIDTLNGISKSIK